MWQEKLSGKVVVKETPLITLRVKVLGSLVVGEVVYNGKTEQVYNGASWYEAKGACDDRAIALLSESRQIILG
jgi:hypothetical protein